MNCIAGHLLHRRHDYKFTLGGNAYNTTEFGGDQGINIYVLLSSNIFFCALLENLNSKWKWITEEKVFPLSLVPTISHKFIMHFAVSHVDFIVSKLENSHHL